MTRGNSTLCKDCRFKENHSTVNFDEHKYFLKMVKIILQENKILYENFAEMINYSAGSVKDFMTYRCYLQQLKETIETVTEKSKIKCPISTGNTNGAGNNKPTLLLPG